MISSELKVRCCAVSQNRQRRPLVREGAPPLLLPTTLAAGVEACSRRPRCGPPGRFSGWRRQHMTSAQRLPTRAHFGAYREALELEGMAEILGVAAAS